MGKKLSFFGGQISINFEMIQLKKGPSSPSKTLGPLGMVFQFIHLLPCELWINTLLHKIVNFQKFQKFQELYHLLPFFIDGENSKVHRSKP